LGLRSERRAHDVDRADPDDEFLDRGGLARLPGKRASVAGVHRSEVRAPRAPDAGEGAANVNRGARYREGVDRAVRLRRPWQWPRSQTFDGGCILSARAVHLIEEATNEDRAATDRKRPNLGCGDAVTVRMLATRIDPQTNSPLAEPTA
jgi:hypothetical protein